jgi:hypothetical protein
MFLILAPAAVSLVLMGLFYRRLTVTVYNYNAYVGTVPAGPPDALDSDGLAGFRNGLHKEVTCEAKPSLPAAGQNSPAIQTASPVSICL